MKQVANYSLNGIRAQLVNKHFRKFGKISGNGALSLLG